MSRHNLLVFHSEFYWRTQFPTTTFLQDDSANKLYIADWNYSSVIKVGAGLLDIHIHIQ